MLETILLAIIAICLVYKTFHKEHAWDIDSICWFEIRDRILKEDYAGCYYSMANSFSPVVIRHRKVLPLDKRHTIEKLFPPWIRVEFQEVEYEGEMSTLYGRGDFDMHLRAQPSSICTCYLHNQDTNNCSHQTANGCKLDFEIKEKDLPKGMGEIIE